MGTPSADQITVAVDRMRAVAGHWEAAATLLETAKGQTDSVKLYPATVGPFVKSLEKYEPAPGYVRERLAEGVQALREIATTLRKCADVYQAEDEQGAHRFNNLY